MCELAILLFEVGRVIPAQPVVECQFAGDLPRILHEQADLVLTQANIVDRRNLYLVNAPQQETGITDVFSRQLNRTIATRGIRRRISR